MPTGKPSDDGENLHSTGLGELAQITNRKGVENDMETVYVFNPDFVIQHWDEFRLAQLINQEEYCLSVIGTKKIMRITPEQAKDLIKRLGLVSMGLIYKRDGASSIGVEWIKGDTTPQPKHSGNLVQRFLANTRRILGHNAK